MLAELLDVLHTSEDRWTTLEADVREWKDRDGLRAAAERESAAFLGTTPARRPPGSPRSDERTGTEERMLSVTATSRRAVRVDRSDDGGRDLLVVDADGGVLHVDAHGVVDTEPNPQRAVAWIRLDLLGQMLAPSLLGGACRLRVTGTRRVAGRECIAAVAVLRPGAAAVVHHFLGLGVRRADLAVDRATGVVLRIEVMDDDGRPLHRLEVRDARFDAPVDERAFSLAPPPGTAPSDEERYGPVPLRQAAALVPFTLLAPASTPEDHPWTAAVTPVREGHPTTVFLHQLGTRLRPGHRLTWVVQSTDPSALPDVTEWTRVHPDDPDDLGAHVWTGDGATDLFAWRDGTGVWIRDADSPEAAVRLLRSMRPVPSTPPAL